MIDGRYKDVPIGMPVDNLKLHVVDKAVRLLPAGAVGELWISGAHVTAGYLNRPEKTAEAYGENPFSSDPGYERVYKTGDIVRLNSGGEIEFGGRIDNQIKLRGFRIELDEIENVMTEYPAVRQIKVIVRNNGSEDCLAAYFTADSAVDLADLTAFMKTKLTYYMIPAAMMQLMSKGIKVEYQNIFDNPTPEMLSDYIASLGKADEPKDGESGDGALTEGAYLDRAIESLITLDYFESNGGDEI